MEGARFAQLSPRHRDVLRLVYRHFTGKEIARELAIAPGTVKGYISEATAILGARNRREAALALHEFETPPKGEGSIGGFVAPRLPEPSAPPIDQRASSWGPLAVRNRNADNDLGIAQRLIWIVALTLFIAIGFGALAAGIRTISDLVAVGHRRG